MTKTIKIGYQNRESREYGGSGVGTLSRDLPSVPKIVLANHFLEKLSGISIGDTVSVHYLPSAVVIRKLTNSNL